MAGCDARIPVDSGPEQGRNSPASGVCYLDEALRTLDHQHQQQPPAPVDGAGGDVEEKEEGTGETSWDRDPESTPRSEVPSASDTPLYDPLPGGRPSGNVQQPADDYFAPRPLRRRPALLTASTERSSSSNTGHSPLEARFTQPAAPAPPEQVSMVVESLGRPSVQRDVSTRSVTSNTSTSTVRASDFLTQLPPHQVPTLRSVRDAPRFPDQAYSALQAQHHPAVYAPRVLRTRSSNPSPYLSYHHHNATPADLPEDPRVVSGSGSRTAGNSPASSPGLFTPGGSPLRQDFNDSDLQGTYSSPYLHYTQRQVPKETHLAEVDVDPISGRKIINHYEIVDELGRGVHGKVKLGRNLKNGQYVAIKIVERYSKRKRLGKSSNHEAKIKREIAILKKARHPNIVSLLEVIDDPGWKKVYIVLEHVEMGEIKWRTEGTKAICLLEYRRAMREERGIFEDEAALMQDERILTDAHRKLQRAERRKWRKLHQSSLDESGADFWSHEYGGETDNDDGHDDGMSRTSTATEGSNERAQIEPVPAVPAGQPDPVFETSIHDDQRKDHEFLELQQRHDQQHPHDHGDIPTSPPREHQHDGFDLTGLEGTMYGAYDFDGQRVGSPDVGESGTSLNRLGRDDDDDQVPEHFRHVPLMTLSAARSAFRDTVLGLEFLHYQGVIHRDIKPANLLQARDHHIKISDFGVSYLGREHPDESESDVPDVDEAVELAKTVGTPAFYAPELCRTDVDEKDAWPVSGQIDIWALGVTLYCLVFGRVPFHDNNTFVLMRRIADEEVYIPRQRLKAVDESAGSRPSSGGRVFRPSNSNKRLPHELEREEVDDDLYDLLRRLLTKDPRKRIKLTEVKHHPWVLRDIEDAVRWLDETDPSRQAQGRRIEVSKEDVDVAVVPLNIVDRVKSIANKVGGALRGAIGGSRQSSRRRAKSSATGSDSQPPSNASSSSTISQDARRQEQRRPSLKPDESIFSALKASRDDHPLSHSVTASPDAEHHGGLFLAFGPRPHSPTQFSDVSDGSREPRYWGGEGLHTLASGSGSIRTIRQVDIGHAKGGASTLPALPSTPLALEMPSGGSLSTIFKGATEKIARTVRSRERKSASRSTRDCATSVETRTEDAHGEPSLGLSHTLAAGQVASPALLRECSTTGSSVAESPISSRAPSVASPDQIKAGLLTPSDEGNLSRQSSLASVTSHSRTLSVPSSTTSQQRPVSMPPQNTYLPLLGPADSTEGRFSRPNPISKSRMDVRFLQAQDELVRRMKLEEQLKREEHARPSSSLSQRPPSARSQGACPPSPDDDIFIKKRQEEATIRLRASMAPSLEEMSAAHIPDDPHYTPGHDNFAGIISSSSDERFTSAMSQSTSNPSIPSVISANSSVLADQGPDMLEDDGLYMIGTNKQQQPPDQKEELEQTSFDSTGTETAVYPNGGTSPHYTEAHQSFYDNDEGYQGDGDHGADNAIESDDSDDDSFIEMTRHKSRTQGLSRSQSISNGELARHLFRKRSGSNPSADMPRRSGTVRGDRSQRGSEAGRAPFRSERSGSGSGETASRTRSASQK